MARTLLAMLSIAALFIAPSRVDGAVITYSDERAFVAATARLTTVDFEGQVPDGGFGIVDEYCPANDGDCALGARFFSPASLLYIVGDDYYYPGNSVLTAAYGTGGVLAHWIAFPSRDSPFGSEISAFGARFGSLAADTAPLGFFLFDSDGGVLGIGGVAAPWPELSFFGFVSDTPFDLVVVIALTDFTGGALNIDDVRYGESRTAVPAPAALSMFALGLAGLSARSWRHGRTAKSRRGGAGWRRPALQFLVHSDRRAHPRMNAALKLVQLAGVEVLERLRFTVEQHLCHGGIAFRSLVHRPVEQAHEAAPELRYLGERMAAAPAVRHPHALTRPDVHVGRLVAPRRVADDVPGIGQRADEQIEKLGSRDVSPERTRAGEGRAFRTTAERVVCAVSR